MKLTLGKKIYGSVAERLLRFIMPVTESGCHLWIGSIAGKGYGYIMGDHGKLVYAHRIAYELAKGPIPEGMQIDHLCKVRCCVNPDHLEAVTTKENGYRSNSVSGLNKRKTHCPKGHPYSGANLHTFTSGHRRCKTCSAETFKRFKLNNPTYMRDRQRSVKTNI